MECDDKLTYFFLILQLYFRCDLYMMNPNKDSFPPPKFKNLDGHLCVKHILLTSQLNMIFSGHSLLIFSCSFFSSCRQNQIRWLKMEKIVSISDTAYHFWIQFLSHEIIHARLYICKFEKISKLFLNVLVLYLCLRLCSHVSIYIHACISYMSKHDIHTYRMYSYIHSKSGRKRKTKGRT